MRSVVLNAWRVRRAVDVCTFRHDSFAVVNYLLYLLSLPCTRARTPLEKTVVKGPLEEGRKDLRSIDWINGGESIALVY